MADQKAIHGQCLCTGVKFEVNGVEPKVQAYCHCESCRRYHAAPIQGVAVFPIGLDEKYVDKEGKFKVTQGVDLITSYHHTDHGPRRAFCQRCGTPLFNIPEGRLGIFAPVIAGDFTFKPSCHWHYGEKVMPVLDGLPKWKTWADTERMEEEASRKGPPREMLATAILLGTGARIY